MKVIKELPFSVLHSLKLMILPIKGYKNHKKKRLPVIVSLTSIEPRLKTLHIVIKSLLYQNDLPKKIILWLNNDLKENIPTSLSKLQSEIFEIKFSPLNCSHRKLIHTLEIYPEEIIITCDDDLIYRKEWLSLLYNEHKKNPTNVIGNTVVHINHDEKTKNY